MQFLKIAAAYLRSKQNVITRSILLLCLKTKLQWSLVTSLKLHIIR